MGREKPSNRLLDIPLANGHGRSHSRNLSAAAAAPEALHLTTSPSSSREESTRVRLQKQRLREQHHAVVIGHRIPGYKTSAGMFWRFFIFHFRCVMWMDVQPRGGNHGTAECSLFSNVKFVRQLFLLLYARIYA